MLSVVMWVNSLQEAFVNFVETEQEPLISFDDVLEAVHKPGAIMSLQERVNGESPTRLYVSAKICCIV